MYTNTVTMREFFASVPATVIVAELFEKGIEILNERLAIAALEELIRREDDELVVRELDWALDNIKVNHLDNRPSIISLMASTLRDSCREMDPVLCYYGKFLLTGCYIGPTEWLKAHAEQYRKVPRSGAIKSAGSWAKEIIFPEKGVSVSPFDDAEVAREWASGAASTQIDHTLPGNDR